MKRSKKPRIIRTLTELKIAFQLGEIDKRYWTTCIDSGGLFLRYLSRNDKEMEPAEPVCLDLSYCQSELLEEALHLAGIPAERA